MYLEEVKEGLCIDAEGQQPAAHHFDQVHEREHHEAETGSLDPVQVLIVQIELPLAHDDQHQ